jgi:hypothetical protein
VLIVRATQKLRQRIGPATLRDGEQSTTLLGEWYATALPWRPRVALLVNEATLLPVLMPLAPATTMLDRVGGHVAAVLAAHGTPDVIIQTEVQRMSDRRVAATANRSVVGVMNEFTLLAGHDRAHRPTASLLDLAVRLAATPCGPLYRTHITPERALAAGLRSIGA